MKAKYIFNLIVVTATFFLTSCTKTYSCHCDTPTGGDEHIEINAKKQATAKSECEAKAPSASYTKCSL